MHPDKLYADIQKRIADGSLVGSPELSTALRTHAHALRAREMNRLVGLAVRGLRARVAAAAAAFAKTPDTATR